ncbi:hypothetical protein BGW36DRAFT_418148 [Talaromyces proteolyticus]|uniref:PHD-type domain-containing protein n=1 Tax=Talaromyces proteolyticus TaxID=1131652 RepID=A0AAD4PZ81_9EURO|nr:uncharacterized protein BGW36DRAFT_418148 [Talaromyces proteolyticus]KAH8695399.1 hypothetical protein BGW36DRAFT_418148 [Talaromyces proteolyticus]
MMVSQHNKVLGPTSPGQVAEPSTSVTSVDTSSRHLLGLHAPSPDQSNNPNILTGDSSTRSRSQASIIPKLSKSTLNLLASIRNSPQESRAKADAGKAWIDPPPTFVNGSSVWNFNPNSASTNASMTVLRNRTIAPRPLAPAPSSKTDTAPVVSTPIAIQRALPPSTLSSQPKPVAQTVISIVPKPEKPKTEQQHVTNEPALPSSVIPPAPPLLLTPSAGQLTPVKPAVRKNTVNSSKRAKRRKRIKAGDSSSSDESSEDMVPMARQTKSGRQVNRPTYFGPMPETKQSATPRMSSSETSPAGVVKRRKKVYRKNGKDLNITCKHCQRSHSSSTNLIVFCDECNVAWHQFCHEPPIAKELIDVKEAEWVCRECRPFPEKQRVALVKLKLPRKKSSVESLPKPLVAGEKFTAEQQRGYLSSLSHTTLVDMLFKLSETNPTLPMFPENLIDLEKSKFAMKPLNTTIPQNEHQQASPVDAPTVTKRGRGEDSDESSSEYEVEEHRLYPQPGYGFFLPLEEDDVDILLEDPACPTFSYTFHGYAKANTISKGPLDVTVAV